MSSTKMLSTIKDLLPSKVFLHQRLSSINVHLESFPISSISFQGMSSSSDGRLPLKFCLPSKVIFHQRWSPIKVRLLSKVVFHWGKFYVQNSRPVVNFLGGTFVIVIVVFL